MQLYGSIFKGEMQLFGSIAFKVVLQMFFPRLEELRHDHDKTQAEIAHIIRCQREVYRRYEKGTRQIPVDALITLSKYYQVSIDYIVSLTNKSTPYPRV